MSASRLLQRALPVFMLLVLATSAYQVALGLTRLVRSVVASRSPVAQEPTFAPDIAASGDAERKHAREPKPAVSKPETERLPAPTTDSYLRAPDCPAIAVRIVSESLDRAASLATLRAFGEARLCRVGDRFAGHRVELIGFNARQSSAAVWLSKDRRLCQALVAAGDPQPQAASPPPENSPDPRVAREISANLKRLSDHEFELSRAQFDSICENALEFGRHLRFVPESKDGRVVGVRLFGVREGSWPAALGLRNGDRLETLNGFQLSKPEAMLEAYARLRTTSEVTARVTRGGTPLEISVHVR